MQPVVAAGALRQYHRCVLSWRGTIVGIGKVVGGGGLFQDDRHHCGWVCKELILAMLCTSPPSLSLGVAGYVRWGEGVAGYERRDEGGVAGGGGGSS